MNAGAGAWPTACVPVVSPFLLVSASCWVLWQPVQAPKLPGGAIYPRNTVKGDPAFY